MNSNTIRFTSLALIAATVLCTFLTACAPSTTHEAPPPAPPPVPSPTPTAPPTQVPAPPPTAAPPAEAPPAAAPTAAAPIAPTTPADSEGSVKGEQGEPAASASQKAEYQIVRVFYATDRLAVTAPPVPPRFAGDRGEISYGSCQVSIPKDHRLGAMEGPSIWKLRVQQDPSKDIVLLSVTASSESGYLEDLKHQISQSTGKNALVFVHGYNVSFADAARRTAQMAYDLEFDGPAIFFSWPSKAKLTAYTEDETNVEWATPHLKQVLKDIVTRTGASNVYLIAHSMGNRALTAAFRDLVTDTPSAREKVREVILAAPDIDADVFKQQLLPAITGTVPNSTHVTLYASSKDEALVASRHFHGYPRAGESEKMILASGLESIDASAVDTGLLGHSYYGDNRSILSDIFYLMRDHIRACHRYALLERESAIGTFCVIER